MIRTPRAAFFVTLLVLFLAGAHPASAQVATGFPPYGSFAGGGFDAVNLQNLNVNFAAPIVKSPGRGMDFSHSIVYDSLIWKQVISGSTTSWTPVTDPSGTPTWGWKKDTPGGSISYKTTTITIKCFPTDGSPWFFTTRTTYSNYVYTDVLGTLHGFSVNYIDDSNCSGIVSGAFTGNTADGSGYYIDITSPTAPVVTSPGGIQSPSGSVTDTNGNLITKTVVSSTETDWKDTAGHTALKIIYGPSSIQYQFLDPTGGYQTATLNLQTFSIKTNFGCAGVVEYSGTASLPASLSLPNGKSYSFTYEPTPGIAGYYTGRIQKVTLPTGGSYEYDYIGANDSINCADSTVTNLQRVLNDGTNTATWQYVRTNISGSAGTTTVTAPQLSYDTAANQAAYTFNTSAQETSRKIYQGGASTGTLLRTFNTTWATNGSPATRITILEDNSTQTEVESTFDSFGNLTLLKEHDWGVGAPGAVVRTTTLSYLATTAYTNLNIRNLLTTKTVADSTGTIKSRIDTAYDGTGSINSPCITGAVQHDDAGHGCAFTARGNATSATTYTDPVTPGGAVTKNFTYDSLGNLRTAQVNCCQQKQWNFSVATNYAYPDSVVSGSSPGPQLSTSATYNASTGQVATRTDENGKVTTWTYGDPGHMNRLTDIARPDGQHVTYNYDDTARTVTVTSPVQGTNVAKQISYFDGLGRPIKQQVSDGAGTSYSIVETQYDSLGRAYKISNPHNSTAQYWTQTNFDALGRAIKTTLPDNNLSTISYAGNSTTTADPAGKQRKAVTDGLGRLSSVYEPDVANGNALTQQTSYAYNVLDELSQVTQGVQTRTYAYDALGRLTSAATPEAGTVSFTYDSFDNLLTRTDARGVVTNYSYDGLNRPSTISYNVGTTGVPATSSVTYTYGTSSASNNNGRLITLTDGVGSENYSYDTFGRVTQLQKVISGTTYTTSYAYNLASELTSITYPSGRAVQQNVDAIGRLSSVVGTLNSVSTTYASGFGYSAAQQVTGFNYGNNINAAFGYSADRLQLTCLDYSTTNRNGACAHDATTKFGLSYSYGSAGSNNGQIAGITDSVDNGRSATYGYDALSRLTSATTTGSTTYPAWGLSESYDRYGNRTAQSVTAGSGPSSSVTVSTATNRLTGAPFAYDANGNMTNDGVNTLAYDAENHAVSATNGSASGTYTYDGNGLRVKKVSGATTTVYIFSATKVIAEYDNSAAPTSPTREYIYSGGALLAKIDSTGTKYYHQDHLSNRLITDSTGTTVAQLGHFPFGESWYNASGDKLLFTTYERDSESGNDFALARYNVNRLARFSAPDAVAGSIADPQSLNRYSYTTDDPINFADPLGLTKRRDHPRIPPRHAIDCTNFQTSIFGSGPDTCNGSGFGDCSIDGIPSNCGVVLSIASIGSGFRNSSGAAITLRWYVPGGGVETFGPDARDDGNPIIDVEGYFFPADFGTVVIPIASDGGGGSRRTARSSDKNARDLEILLRGLYEFTHPLEVVYLNEHIFLGSGVLIFGGGVAITAACLEPTPFEPLTCGLVAPNGAAVIGGGLFLGNFGVQFFKNETLPSFKEWWNFVRGKE